jgi:PAS domain-containing protein
MRLNTRMLVPWLFFSLMLIGGLLLFEWQLRTLQRELREHIAVHQQIVQVVGDLRYLSLQRLTTALQHQLGQAGPIRQVLALSDRQTGQLLAELERLLSDSVHQTNIERGDQGRSILVSYELANRNLPALYEAWLGARDTPGSADEPLRQLQLMLQFEVVKALLDDLRQYHAISQDLVTAQVNVRIERTQVTFYSFMAMMLLAVIGFSLHQGYTIAKPLRQLSRMARAVAQGHEARFDIPSSIDEIVTLKRAITRMVGQLKGYIDQLSARQEEILGQMAELAQVGGWELDLATNKLTWTREVYRIHEVDPTDQPTLDQGIHCYAPEAQPRIQAALDQAIQEGTPWDLELPFITAKGHHRWVRTQGKPILRDGQVRRLNGAFQDITEQRRTLDAIRQANADLEAFSYSVSHDLRAPLRAIDGFIAILLEEHADQLDDEGRRMFGVVQDNARKMGSLIDDILAFSRAGRLAMEWQEVDMNALLQEVWSGLDTLRAGREVRLVAGELPAVWGDPRALRQIWSNLLAWYRSAPSP